MRITPFIRSVGIAALSVGFMSTAASEFQTRYFLAAGKPGTPNESKPSYVVPIRTQEELDKVLEYMKTPLYARDWTGVIVAAGPDWINRDHMSSGKPIWHWHVTEYKGFVGGGSPIIVKPEQIERDPKAYVAATNGGHLYWPLVRELSLEEVFWVRPRMTEEGMQLSWMELGEGYEYTVEVSAVGAGVWEVAPGEWPTTGTSWLDDGGGSGSEVRLYKVRAERVDEE